MTDSESLAGQKPPEPTQPVEAAPPEPGQETEEPQEDPQYVTKEQLDSAVADAVRNVKMADKQRAKQIKQEIATLKERIKSAGLELSPEQESKLESEVIAGYEDSGDDEDPQQPPAPEDMPPIVGQAIGMMKEAGLYVEEGDPEFDEYIKAHLANPDTGLLLATAQAIEAKKARTNFQKEKAPLRTPTPQGGPAPRITYDPKRPPSSYFEQYEREKQGR